MKENKKVVPITDEYALKYGVGAFACPVCKSMIRNSNDDPKECLECGAEFDWSKV